LDLGISNYNNRTIARDTGLITKYLSNIVVLKFLFAIVYIAITLIVALIIGFNEYQLKLLIWLGINQIIASFILYLRSNVTAFHLFKTDSFLSVLDRVIMIIICSWLLWVSKTISIENFIYAQTVSYSISAIIGFIVVITKTSIQFQLDRSLIFKIIKQGYPYALLIFMMTIYNKVDGIMIERLLGSEGNLETGIYASGYRLLDAVNQVGLLFGLILMPIFSRMLKNNESINELLTLSFKTMFVFAFICSLSCYVFQFELMIALYKEINNTYPSEIFGLLILSFNAVSSVYIFGTLLTANNNLKALNIIAFSGMTLNIVLNFIFIPEFKAIGAAYTTLTTQVVVAIAHIFVCIYYFRFGINWKLMLQIILFVGTSMLIVYGFSFIELEWNLKFIGLIIALSTMALLFKMIDIRHWLQLLKTQEK